ncbi:MAG TPA: hypothetical protein VHB97_18860 [Polyangia bacterium]|nr:hypothetical protein [Polyangia bacterium]
MRPDDFTLFSEYHLGLDSEGAARFSNIHDLAQRHSATVDEVQAWLVEGHIDAATVEVTDYDLASQHGEAQVLAVLGDAAATLAFAHRVYDEYRARLGHKRVRTFADDEDEKTHPNSRTLSDAEPLFVGDHPRKN